MPRKQTPPTYLKRTEKGKDYAYCYLFGAQKRLGSYGTKESFRRFESCIRRPKDWREAGGPGAR